MLQTKLRVWLYLSVTMGLGLLALLPQPVQARETVTATIPPANQRQIFLPSVQSFVPAVEKAPVPTCPTSSTRTYLTIPIEPPVADHPDTLHGDLNLALRGYVPTKAPLEIVDVNGPTDVNAPQLPGLFGDGRTPVFSSAHRVYDWDWGCGEHGCRSPHLTPREVSLLGLVTHADESISFPSRGPEIYGGGFTTLVLYAAEDRITLGYTRRDSVAPGYAVHIEKICLDPNLLALYRQANAAGRATLPALRNGDVLGIAQHGEILVAVRDRGTFMEPRSRKDWWKGR